MKYLDEYRDGKAAQEIAARLSGTLGDRKATLMEVCGTHTMAIFRSGLRDLLPTNLKLLAGPGCPVCVTPNVYLDRSIAFSRVPEVIVTTFGDMMRVPGSTSSLEKEKATGREVRVVYSTLQALQIAERNPDRKVIFLGVGFETTAPTIAASILEAHRRNLGNYYIHCGHKVMPPPMAALLEDGELDIDGFLCPGHVSTITGSRIYEFIARDHGVPCVVAGFEPLDVLLGTAMLVDQIVEGRATVENEYTRAVKHEGNLRAQGMLNEVFEPEDSDWRGIGVIPGSGLKIRRKYGEHDAEAMIPVEVEPTVHHQGCICGRVLKGTHTPDQCPLFRKTCTPETPLGACMVSSEGTCAAFYKYS